VRVVVTNASDHATVASHDSAAKVQTGPSPDLAGATIDCIDATVSALIDNWLAQLVDERAGYDQPAQAAP
jgi:hypothetical protein